MLIMLIYTKINASFVFWQGLSEVNILIWDYINVFNGMYNYTVVEARLWVNKDTA